MNVDDLERQHFNEQDAVVAQVERTYLDIIKQIAPIIATNTSKATIMRKLDTLLTATVRNITVTIETGMQKSWDIANERTRVRVEGKYTGIELPPRVQEALDDRRGKAARSFQRRKEAGMDLSDRVWKQAREVRSMIETKIDAGIGKGRSAASVARELRSSLQDEGKPDGKGGVYRSPVKNTERLARTEINMSYRMADQVGWENNPLVLGYRIELSTSAKPKIRCEVCRSLAGVYPKWFVWNGNHPHCLCFKTPILMSRKMLDKFNKLIAQGKDTPEAYAKLVKGVLVNDVPDNFKGWVTDNAERVLGWKKQPYFWQNNIKTVNSLLRGAN